MMLTISNGSVAISIDDPQEFSITPEAITSTQKTLGGQVVQLLGYSMSGSFSGIVNDISNSTYALQHIDNAKTQILWPSMQVFSRTMRDIMKLQKDGHNSHFSCDFSVFPKPRSNNTGAQQQESLSQFALKELESPVEFDCVYGNLSINDSLSTNAYAYSLSFDVVQRGRRKSAYNSAISNLLKNIGDMDANAYHGGGQDLSQVKTITGFNAYGPTVQADPSQFLSVINGNTKLTSTTQEPGQISLQTTAPSGDMQKWTHDYLISNGYSEQDFTAADYIISHESGWRVNATNPSSGAYGLPQALPGNKMASAGADWQTNYQTQIKWFISYCNQRYGGLQQAYSFWVANHWY